MDTARYVVALMVMIALPPGLALWFCIHPFASFWRKFGTAWTYTLLAPPMLALSGGLFAIRETIAGVDYGTSYVTIALGGLSLVASIILALKRRRLLTTRILVGMPELSERQYPGKLLTEGIYSRIRHPRYVEIVFGVLGYALFANYLGAYVAAALLVPMLYLIVLLEERELRERFGAEYDEYARRVPRFVPRRRPEHHVLR